MELIFQHLAVGLIERRLLNQHKKSVRKPVYEIHGFPKDIDSAHELANNVSGGRLEFQDWIIEAKIGGIVNPKKTADGGWDGHHIFNINGGKKVILIEVKSGNVNVKNLREFIQVVNKAKADMGVLICFEEQVTKPMKLAAKEEGYFMPDVFVNRYDKIQILTVEELLEHKEINMSDSTIGTYKKAERVKTTDAKNQRLFEI